MIRPPAESHTTKDILVTDVDGWFDTGIAPAKKATLVRVAAPGYRDGVGRFQWREAEIEVELAPLTRLAGRVLAAATRAPIAGATVSWDNRVASTETGIDGRFETEIYPAGVEGGVAIEAAGYGAEFFPFRLTSTDAGEERDFLLEAARRVTGRVVDFATGAPLEGASVSYAGGQAETDAEGRFALDFVESPEPATLRAGRDGYAELQARIDAFPETEAEFRLPRTATLAGVVRDSSSHVLPEALVFADGWGANPERLPGSLLQNAFGTPFHVMIAIPSSGRTDAEGHYRLDGLCPWMSPVPLRVVTSAGEQHDVTIDAVLEPGSTTRFDLLLSEDTSTTAAKATLTGEVYLNGEPQRALISVRVGKHKSTSTSYNPAKGPYRLEVPAGEIALSVRPTTMAFSEGIIDEPFAKLLLAPGEERRHDFHIDVKLGPIRGRVVDGSGSPVGDELVAAEAPPVRVRTRSRRDGSFRIQVPTDASYDVRLSGEHRSVAVFGVEPGGDEVVLRLPEKGKLSMRALDAATDAPLAGLLLHWRRAGTTGSEFVLLPRGAGDIHGWYELELPVGPLELALRDDGETYRPGETTVTIPPDGAAEVELALEPGLELRLSITGNAIPRGHGHACLLVEERHVAYTTSDDAGAALAPDAPLALAAFPTYFFPGDAVLVKGLAPGPHRIIAASGDPLPARRPARPGGRRPRTAALRRARRCDIQRGAQ